MIIGCRFICLFAVLINKVSLDVTVEAVIGGSVVLPCSSVKHDLKLQDIDVFWRDKDSETIYDFIKGTDFLESQDPRYKNRAQTFPDEYKRGNFSIKLINLTHADAGEFICYITPSNEQETVHLIIKESTTENENQSTEEANGVPKTQLDWWQILLICVCILLVLILPIAYFKWKQRKRTPAPI
ncbi:CD276 antigen homolog [Sinocyclocheilus rhinocerous]|uniref:CD276 antigen homolog n=1 Tax=Sinocyclocheilus rhinocerous TaxID=307959 RepID=UPI0007B995CA|nr:PREDICTED: CD276 antigen homolog [Sinocyclocheilus rhinocerous]